MNYKEKKWWQHLLAIPVMAVIDVVIFVILTIIETTLSAGEGQGHPAPSLTIIAFFVLLVITAVVVVIAIIRAVRSGISQNKSTPSTVCEETNEVKNATADPKPAWKYFIPFFIQIVISIVLVVICGSSEINKFYSNPDHIGFAVPIVTFVLFGILFLLAVITLVITLVVVSRRKKK